MKKIQLLAIMLSLLTTGFTFAAEEALPRVTAYPFYNVTIGTWERRYPINGFHGIQKQQAEDNNILTKLEWTVTICHDKSHLVTDRANVRLHSFKNGSSLNRDKTESVSLNQFADCTTVRSTIDYRGLNLKFEDIPQIALYAWSEGGGSGTVTTQAFTYVAYYESTNIIEPEIVKPFDLNVGSNHPHYNAWIQCAPQVVWWSDHPLADYYAVYHNTDINAPDSQWRKLYSGNPGGVANHDNFLSIPLKDGGYLAVKACAGDDCGPLYKSNFNLNPGRPNCPGML